MGKWLIHVKLLIVAIIWGLGWPAGRVVATEMLPFAASWIRYVFATSAFLFVLKFSGQWMIPHKSEWQRLFLIGFFSTCVYQAFFMVGMQYTAAGDASLMITFNPIFTAILAIFFVNEKMTTNLALGLTLGISGIAVLLYYSPNVDISFTDRAIGNSFIAGAALAWACNTILMKKVMTEPKTNERKSLTPLELTVWSSVAGFLILTPITLSEAAVNGVHYPSMDAWIGMIFLALFSTVIAYVWFADGIQKIGAAKSSLYVYLVPPSGILGGFFLLGEKLGFSLLVAFVLITSGVIIAQKNTKILKQAS